MIICFHCYNEFDDSYDVCPHCGTVRVKKPKEPIQLIPETVLCDRYVIGPSLGKGGFGIVYKAWDKKLNSIVAVKEFFVSRLMTRAEGEKEVIVNRKSGQEFLYRKKRFLAEARTMAKFGSHPNIPNVFEFFEENGTAYIVMELLKGQSLSEYLMKSGKRLDTDFAVFIINEVGKALTSMHENGIVHRDVAPDNIFICDGHEIGIKLMDLGAAKLADETDDVIDIILKPGYSPFEQYDKSDNIGPWTDVYALGATLYFIMTGKKPDESTNRKIEDEVVPPHELNDQIPENLSNAIMKALAVDIHMRFKDVNSFLEAVNGEKKVVSLAKEKKRRSFRRASGIVAAVLAVAIVSTTVSAIFMKKRSVQYLKADIDLWFSVADGSNEESAIRAITEDFMVQYPGVKITVRAIPENEYASVIQNAKIFGELPDLFESTGLSEDILKETADVSEVLESEQAKDCWFLDKYDGYYSERKQIPLGIEVPMVCVITKGQTYSDYVNENSDDDDRLFATADELSEAKFYSADGTELTDADGGKYISLDPSHYSLIRANFGEFDAFDEKAFYDNETAVLFTSTMELNTIKQNTVSFEKSFLFCNEDDVKCNFVYEWSVGNGSSSEKEAAMRLLTWMLGFPYQNQLMTSECNDGQIPLNKEAFNKKLDSRDLKPLGNTRTVLTFEPITEYNYVPSEPVTDETAEPVEEETAEQTADDIEE